MPHDEPRAGLPSWLTILLIVLVLCAGGWLVWWQFGRNSESVTYDVGTIPDRYQVFRGGGGGAAPARPDLAKDGVHALGANMFRVTSGEFFMTLAPTETTFAPLRLNLSRRDFLSQDQRILMRICNETANAGFAKNIEITPDQAKKLTPLRQQIGAGMKISDDDRNKLRALWKDWNAAKDPTAKTATDTALVAAMKDVGARNAEAFKQELIQLTGEIRKVVTDTQIAKYRQLRGQGG